MTKAYKHFQAILSEGLFVSALALFLGVLSFATFMQVMQLPNLADALPADSTAAYIVMDTDAYLSSVREPSLLVTDMLNYSVSAEDPQEEEQSANQGADSQDKEVENTSLDFAGDHIAFVFIEGELLPMIEVASKSRVRVFMETAGITDYIYVKDFLVMTPSPKVRVALESVDDGAQTVEETEAYGNARGRLPYFSDAFAYIDLRATRMELVQFLGEFGYYEPGYFETILQIFPSAGVSIKMEPASDSEPGFWDAELFMAVDKDQLNGEAFYRSSSRYSHKLVEYSTGDYAFEWGGQDLTNQLSRMSEILAIRNKSAQIFFDGSVKEKFATFFGNNIDLEEIYSVLGEEYYLGWTPGESMLFMAELESDEALKQAQILKDAFAANYTYLRTYQKENGEVKAESLHLDGTIAEHNGIRYYRFGHDEETFIRLTITEDYIIVSTSEADFFATLDKIQTGQNLNKSSDTDKLFMGADEISVLNLEFFPEGHILKSLLDNFGKIISSRKIFDDGVYSRYSITLRPSEESETTDGN